MKIKSNKLILLLLLGTSNQAILKENPWPQENEEITELVTLNKINDMVSTVNLAQLQDDDVNKKYSNPYFSKIANSSQEIKGSQGKWQQKTNQKCPPKPPYNGNCNSNPGNCWGPPNPCISNPWQNACEIVAAEGFQDIEVSSTLTSGTNNGVPGTVVGPLLNRYAATLGNLLLNNIPSTNPTLLNDVKVGAWSPFIYNAQIPISATGLTTIQPGLNEWIQFTFKKQVNILGVRIQGLDNTVANTFDFGHWSKWFVTWNDIQDHTMKTFTDAGWTQDALAATVTPNQFNGPSGNTDISTTFFFKPVQTNLIRISMTEFAGNRPLLRIGLIVSEDSGLCKSKCG